MLHDYLCILCILFHSIQIMFNKQCEEGLLYLPKPRYQLGDSTFLKMGWFLKRRGEQDNLKRWMIPLCTLCNVGRLRKSKKRTSKSKIYCSTKEKLQTNLYVKIIEKSGIHLIFLFHYVEIKGFVVLSGATQIFVSLKGLCIH